MRRQHQLHFHWTLYSFSARHLHGYSDGFVPPSRHGFRLDRKIEPSRLDDGYDLCILIHGTEADPVLTSIDVLYNAHTHDTRAACAPHLHPWRQIHGIIELVRIGRDCDCWAGHTLQVAHLAVRQTYLDGAGEAA